ncbi:hypothetical protein DM01DRAFT_1403027 [Hesseltinella vesiculosa]|uniref:HECT-type E3 ubiquitin transferase n=1 Tax=Hesseltinella vesiculosa TaxID=101127 RepID=A0A1X2GWT9_9FUNG|nr:hypothetical protein DM01DRAFT_1403027 [Hesseltinella vesiculosa]
MDSKRQAKDWPTQNPPNNDKRKGKANVSVDDIDSKYQRKQKKQPDPVGLPEQDAPLDETDVAEPTMSYFGLLNSELAQDSDTGREDDEDSLMADTTNHLNDDVMAHQASDDDLSPSDKSLQQDEMQPTDEDVEDDDDDMDDMHELERVRRNFDIQLQRMFGGVGSELSNQLRSLLNTLKSQDDPTMQLVALQELAEILSVSNEETLAGYFPSDSFVKELVRIMKGSSEDMMMAAMAAAGGNDFDLDNDMMLALAMSGGLGSGGNPEIMLLACRCLSNLLDALPTSVTHVVYHGGIQVLCQKLKSIEYIDLAEQALSALDKVSAQLPRAVIQEDGITAALMYFDFFSIHSQRTALRIAANCLRNIDKSSFSQVQEILPILMNTIAYPDRMVVELSCLCWLRIVESYRSQPDLIEQVVSLDILKVILGLIPVPGNSNAARPNTFMDLLRILRSIVKCSPKLCCELLKLGLIDILYKVITDATSIADDPQLLTSHVSLDPKWRDSIYTILKIIIDCLPPLPKGKCGQFSSKRFKQDARTKPIPPTVDTDADLRTCIFSKQQDLLHHVNCMLFPLLLETHNSIVNVRVRQLITHTLVKLVHFSDETELRTVLKDIAFSGFLASILTQQEHPTLVTDSLHMTEILIAKLTDIYLADFQHEGVIHEVELIAHTPPEESKPTTPTTSSSPTNPMETSSPALHQLLSPAKSSSSSPPPPSAHSAAPTDDDTAAAAAADEDTLKDTDDALPASTSEHQHDNGDDDDDNSQDDKSILPRLLQREKNLPAILRARLNLHASLSPSVDAEKGIGQGSIRRYIIQLAQVILQDISLQMVAHAPPLDPHADTWSASAVSTSRPMAHLTQMAERLGQDMTSASLAGETLTNLYEFASQHPIGISSFELRKSGLLEALCQYLSPPEHDPHLSARRSLFTSIFLHPHNVDQQHQHHVMYMLVRRLQELVSRFEQYQVTTPLDSTSSDIRNPTAILAKQLRLRLTGLGHHVPVDYRYLMVSTHAVATLHVIEEYLLARLALVDHTSSAEDTNEDEDEDEPDIHHTLDHSVDVESSHDDQEPEHIDEMDLDEPFMSEEKDQSLLEGQKEQAEASTSMKKGRWQIKFTTASGSHLSNDCTIYHAIHATETEQRRMNVSSSASRNIWLTSYPINFERVWVDDEDQQGSDKEKAAVAAASPTTDNAASAASPSSSTAPAADSQQTTKPIATDPLPNDKICEQAVQLLGALHSLAQHDHALDAEMAALFISRKLTAKVNRQLEELLIVASACLPPWLRTLMNQSPFLFPFETRFLYIQSTSFGYSRLISRWQSLQTRNQQHLGDRGGTLDDSQQQSLMLSRLERQKVRMNRQQMLESAVKMMDLFANTSSVLEVEFVDEEGTGLGPTLEFYASTSQEFCKKSLKIWCDDDESYEHDKTRSSFVSAPRGLFPRPMLNSSPRTLTYFKALGRFVARSMLDFRIIDIPFSTAFFQLVFQNHPSPMELIKHVDPGMARMIAHLQKYMEKKRHIYKDENLTAEEKDRALSNITVDDTSLDDLCLYFTLPGNTHAHLRPDGDQIDVTIHNVGTYIDMLLDALVGSGIAKQIEAFRQGFNDAFSIQDLKILSNDELVQLFSSALEEDWSLAVLGDSIKADHGYTMDSPTVANLLQILSSLDQQGRRDFLQFTTGSPRLPIGGWKALRPLFTVVRKVPEAPLTADDYLPSVMTCANYLKMPDFSSKETMAERLQVAIKEGKDSFLLS